MHRRWLSMRSSGVALTCASLWLVLGGCPREASVATLEPGSGPATGGTQFTITGGDFKSAPLAVTLNDVAASGVALINSTTITAVSPPGEPGTATLALRFADGTVLTVADAFTYLDVQTSRDLPLTITALAPNSGPTAGGTKLAIQGSNFVPDAVLLIGDAPAPNFTFISERIISVVTPPGAAGNASVVLTSGDGRTTAFAPGFLYLAPDEPPPPGPTLTAVAPEFGPVAGGTEVTLTGTGFAETKSVAFGDTPATLFTILSDTKLQAVAPATAMHDTVLLTVTTPHGSASALYTYNAPDAPTVGSVSPGTGPVAGGTVVTISGTGLAHAAAVEFGGVAATLFTVFSDRMLQVVAPAQNAPGTVPLNILTPHGNTGALFTYTAPGTPGDSCENPFVIEGTLPQVRSGNTCTYESDYAAPAWCASPSDARDVVYRWTPAASGTYTVSLCGSGYDTVVIVYEDACAGAPLACNDDACDVQSQVDVPMSAGHAYYIVVSGWDASCGDYELTLSATGP